MDLFWVQSQPALSTEFQESQGYVDSVLPYPSPLKMKKNKTKTQNIHNYHPTQQEKIIPSTEHTASEVRNLRGEPTSNYFTKPV